MKAFYHVLGMALSYTYIHRIWLNLTGAFEVATLLFFTAFQVGTELWKSKPEVSASSLVLTVRPTLESFANMFRDGAVE